METMVTPRKGDWMQTFTGRQFWPLDPRVEEVCIEDIAHSLALQCRYAGHCRVPYSVAEHSVRVCWYVGAKVHEDGRVSQEGEARLMLAALLHDASEAYLVDLPRPVKRHMPDYRPIEDRVTAAVESWAGLPAGLCAHHLVKEGDEVILATEARDLLGPHAADWNLSHAPLPKVIVPWSWQEAERAFLTAYRGLSAEIVRLR